MRELVNSVTSPQRETSVSYGMLWKLPVLLVLASSGCRGKPEPDSPPPPPANSSSLQNNASRQDDAQWRHSTDWNFWVVVLNGHEETPRSDFENLPPSPSRLLSAYASPEALCSHASRLVHYDKLAIGLDDIPQKAVDCVREAGVTHLALSFTDIQEWEALALLPTLEGLHLAIANPDEATLGRIASQPNAKQITSLELSLVPINESLVELARLPKLEYLDLTSTSTTDLGASHIGKLSNLAKLSISGGPLSDRGVMHLSALAKLTHLNLGWTQVTDAAIPELAKLSALEYLVLTDSNVSQAGVDLLSKRLPNTEIRH